MLKNPLFVVSFACLGLWLVLYRLEIWTNLEVISANWVQIAIGTATIVLLSMTLIKLEQRTNRQENKPVLI